MIRIVIRRWVATVLSVVLLTALLVPGLPGARTARAASAVPEAFLNDPEVKEFLRSFVFLSQDELKQVLALEDPDHPDRLPVWVEVQAMLAMEAEYEEWKWALDPNQNGGTRTLGQALKQINVVLKAYEKVVGIVPEMLFPPAAVAEASDIVVGSVQWYMKWLWKMRSWHKTAQASPGLIATRSTQSRIAT